MQAEGVGKGVIWKAIYISFFLLPVEKWDFYLDFMEKVSSKCLNPPGAALPRCSHRTELQCPSPWSLPSVFRESSLEELLCWSWNGWFWWDEAVSVWGSSQGAFLYGLRCKRSMWAQKQRRREGGEGGKTRGHRVRRGRGKRQPCGLFLMVLLRQRMLGPISIPQE